MHAAQAHVDAMAAVMSAGHATAYLHPRPHDKNLVVHPYKFRDEII